MNRLRKQSRLLTPFPLNPWAHLRSKVPFSQKDLETAATFFNRCKTQLRTAGSNDLKPRDDLPEVMLLGRSNVGKSSLITTLVLPTGTPTPESSKDLAKSSSRPGFTQTLNIYTCGRKLRLVDTPGYGYGSKNDHGGLVVEYLASQRALRRAYVLIDSTVGVGPQDQHLFEILCANGVPWHLVFTKLDRHIGSTIGKGSAEALSESSAAAINAVVDDGLKTVDSLIQQPETATIMEDVFATSSSRKLGFLGIRELRASIYEACS